MKIPFIKREAVVSVQFGTEIIQGLQTTLTNILQGHSQEEVEQARTDHQAGKPIPQWAIDASVLTRLLSAVLEEAQRLDMVEYKELDSTLQGVFQS